MSVSSSETSWSTQQLVEFLALVSSFKDSDSAMTGAVERAAEAFDAEVGAIVRAELLELGCRLGQGFYYFRPMELDAIGTLLANRNAAGRWPEPSAEARPGAPA